MTATTVVRESPGPAPGLGAACAAGRPLAPPPWWRRAWAAVRDHPDVADPVFAATLTGLGLLSLWLVRITYTEANASFSVAWGVGGMLGMTLPLAVRHRYPAVVLIVTSVAFIVFRVERVPEGTVSSVVPFLAVYGAGAYLSVRLSVWLRGLAVFGFACTLAASLFQVRQQLPALSGHRLLVAMVGMQAYSVLMNLLFFLVAWLLGDAVRRRREREAELAQRAAELVRANAVIADQAVTEERVRIARELHDVVAHHVSVMGIQAGAARRVLDRDPVRATEVLCSIEESSRQALGDLHRLLGFLRSSGDHGGTSPLPTLAELTNLVDRMRTAGLDVRMAVTGERGVLSPAVELSAYRIVQEALTNTLKHAGSQARTEVVLDYRPTELRLSISDEGPAVGVAPRVASGDPRAGPAGSSRGLIGMRERVGLLGGELAAGPAGNGYRVHATIPV
jgi:signal transduction histidine kinase